MQIYDHDARPLSELIKSASSEHGATLLVPDLQRPYVWTPSQVTLLVDSMLRGWPFGTLLLWDVRRDDLASIPSRPFWKVVDRTGDDDLDAERVSKSNPPGEFRMVLDGQQRLQSLVLAFGGDAWGFRLLDRDWSRELETEAPKGKNSRKHWSLGHLCLDLVSFGEQLARVEDRDVTKIEFRDVLRWVVQSPKGGRSTHVRPANYRDPLPDATKEAGRFLRLSRLYQLAAEKVASTPVQYEASLEKLLESHDVTPSASAALKAPLAVLVFTLRSVQGEKVPFLFLRPFDDAAFAQEVYNDAVVNIFTRLNTAGRALSRQEITFAWIKTGWDPAQTSHRTAGQCFDDLRKDLKDEGINLDTDELVTAISIMWAVTEREGSLLTGKDLLRREMATMAQDIAPRWSVLAANARDAAAALAARGLRFGEHYQSLNVLALLMSWRLLGARWLAERGGGLGVTARDAYEKQLDTAFAANCDRWMIISQWSGRWGKSTTATLAGYAKDLASDWATIGAATDTDQVLNVMQARMTDWFLPLHTEAAAYVDKIGVTSRDAVHQYYLPLWVWHRLDAARWQGSTTILRDSARGRVMHDVDHVVAVSLWSQQLPTTESAEVAAEIVNELGNCCLLEKTFNIAKSAKPLASFLAEVHEFKSGKLEAKTWAATLGIDHIQLDPAATGVTPEQIASAISARTAAMKSDLRRYVAGEIERADV